MEVFALLRTQGIVVPARVQQGPSCAESHASQNSSALALARPEVKLQCGYLGRQIARYLRSLGQMNIDSRFIWIFKILFSLCLSNFNR